MKGNLQSRLRRSRSILKRYPDKIPIIINSKSKNINLSRTNFIIPDDMTVSMFICYIRKNITLDQNQSIYMFTEKGILIPSSYSLHRIYNEYKNQDGYLYLTIALENTFG